SLRIYWWFSSILSHTHAVLAWRGVPNKTRCSRVWQEPVMMNLNKLSLNTATTPRRPLLSRETLALLVDRMVARWLQRSAERAAWRRHVLWLDSA
ncbi:MAG: hypothetical protein ACI8S6_002350, partial [Myxococcota bacterium]